MIAQAKREPEPIGPGTKQPRHQHRVAPRDEDRVLLDVVGDERNRRRSGVPRSPRGVDRADRTHAASSPVGRRPRARAALRRTGRDAAQPEPRSAPRRRAPTARPAGGSGSIARRREGRARAGPPSSESAPKVWRSRSFRPRARARFSKSGDKAGDSKERCNPRSRWAPAKYSSEPGHPLHGFRSRIE